MFGLDEAGRGPVLGPLCIGFVDGPVDAIPDAVADSKTLAKDTRDRLATTITADTRLTTHVTRITPRRIDTASENLTVVTATEMAALITDYADARTGVVDACHSDPAVFHEYVTRELPDRVADRVSIRAEHGADEDVPAVMAASILAKHDRDRCMDRVRKAYSEYGEVGSGYPHDPATKSFLEQYLSETGSLPPIARRTWETSREAVAQAEQTAITQY